MMSGIWKVQKVRRTSLTQDDTGDMTILSQIPILDGEEWSLSEAIDGGVSVSGIGNDELDTNPTKGSG